MMVACSLVNRTTWECARPVFKRLQYEYNTIVSVANVHPERLIPLLEPLGFGEQRAYHLVRFANQWLRRRPRTADDVRGMMGMGDYAADSWALFVEGREDVEPKDGKLVWYVQKRRRP